MTTPPRPPSSDPYADPLVAVAGLPGVAEAVAHARRAVDELLGHRVLRSRSTEVSAEAALRGARASAALEGADVPLTEIRSGVALGDDATGRVARAAVRVSAEVAGLVSTWEHAPGQVLARLHSVAAVGIETAEALGRPRSDEAEVADPLGLGGAPPAAAVGPRLDGLARLVAGGSEAPALVVGAIVHGELATLRPFGWGNGLVARAAQRLVFVGRGLDPKAVTAPEVGHLELGPPAYADALAAFAAGTPAGVVAWVRHCADAVALGARDSVAVCEALQRG